MILYTAIVMLGGGPIKVQVTAANTMSARMQLENIYGKGNIRQLTRAY